MRFKSTIAAVLAVAATGITGAGNAAVVPIEQSLNLHMPHGRGLQHRHKWPGGELHHAFYTLYTETNAGIEADSTGAPVHSWAVMEVPRNYAIPFHLALVSGEQYVLQINTPQSQRSTSTKISAVPLPSALWLFGSALIAFLGISRRRRK